ncbi:hypothetical protein PVL30_003750 [Lodderomyces elongisporus]|uniref:uncharacterized protein n=1 Tax=Lodderomyces elongisporus TaxID=36914 RepID=UPI002922A915|nr:uncharacterized protein PVL30_003750 [Lodderomyces elongisporus]WLF79982.1 hypothetical protein PVL30_003750 [Lodderomyces elongisporus]
MSVTFDLFSLAICISGLRDTTRLKLPPYLQRGGHLQFLTNISLVLTIAYLVTSVTHPSSIFYTMAVNLEFAVTASYWTLHLVLPHLLNTDTIERNFALDFKIHLWPYVSLIIKDEKRNVGGIIGSGVVLILYWMYIEFIARDPSQKFAYPFLNRGGVGRRAAWMLGIWLLSSFNYIILKYVKKL